VKLLVSPLSVEEAIEALDGGADIIDVKNPDEGSLGANFPWVIQSVKTAVGKKVPVSATIGDMEFKPGTAALAALGAALAGADYIKVGLFGVKNEEQAFRMMKKVSKAVKDYNPDKKVVAAGYADYTRINSVSPFVLPSVCEKADVDIVMVDTGIKDGKSSFEFMGEDGLSEFVELAHSCGLECALAGTLKFENVDALKRIKPDIVGVRGVVCGGDRKSSIKKELVKKFKESLM
jgi:hypothetical protein